MNILAKHVSLASRHCEDYSFWSMYLMALHLKFQKARTKIEVVLLAVSAKLIKG